MLCQAGRLGAPVGAGLGAELHQLQRAAAGRAGAHNLGPVARPRPAGHIALLLLSLRWRPLTGGLKADVLVVLGQYLRGAEAPLQHHPTGGSNQRCLGAGKNLKNQ